MQRLVVFSWNRLLKIIFFNFKSYSVASHHSGCFQDLREVFWVRYLVLGDHDTICKGKGLLHWIIAFPYEMISMYTVIISAVYSD